MRMTLKSRPWRKMFLMDWNLLFPLWAKSDQYQTAIQKTPRVRDAYCSHWFVSEQGKKSFYIGEVNYYPGAHEIHFLNGIHRTRVISSHARLVPLVADSTF